MFTLINNGEIKNLLQKDNRKSFTTSSIQQFTNKKKIVIFKIIEAGYPCVSVNYVEIILLTCSQLNTNFFMNQYKLNFLGVF